MTTEQDLLSPRSFIRVLVIVDSEARDGVSVGRRSFWKDACARFGDIFEITEVSVAERHAAGAHVDVGADRWNIVVLNWDVADGDPKFASDRTRKILRYHYQDDFKDFIQAGGILLIEAQTSYWSPDQGAYDAILGPGEIKVGPTGRFASSGRTSLKGVSYSEHPAMKDLPKRIEGRFIASPGTPWFPPGSVSSKVVERNDPDKIHVGYFTSWTAKWLPLLCDENDRPVLLIKNDGYGFVVASTMFIASSGCTPLIRSLFINGLHERLAVREYHKKAKRLRILGWIILPVLLLVSAAVAGLIAEGLGASPVELFAAALTGFVLPAISGLVYKRHLSALVKRWTGRLLNK